MASLALSLFGDFEARLSSGDLLTISGRKAQALLACLAVSPGNSTTRDRLAGVLWSDRDDGHARNSLRQTLTALRRDLTAIEPLPLIAERDRVALDGAAIDVDVCQFEKLAASNRYDDLQKASALYRGDFLDGIHLADPAFEEWLAEERERLRQLAANVLERLIDGQSGAAAIATAQRLLALDPLREASHRILMRAYASNGEADLALRQYEACREILRRELGVDPEAETEEVRLHIRESRYAPPHGLRSSALAQASANNGQPVPSRKPTVAVLPFANMSGDPDQRYFSDGITEDIITALSWFRSLFVTAQYSSFAFREKALKVREIAKELGVSYIIEGSVRRAGSRIRITAQLVEAATENHLWAERYDRDLQDVFAIQDDVVATIVARVAGQIEGVGMDRARRKPTGSLEAYDCYLRGVEHCRRLGSDDFESARQMFERAISADPNFAQAYAGLTSVLIHLHWAGAYSAKLSDAGLDRALEAATRAVALDSHDSFCHRALAQAHYCRKSHELARHHLEIAMKLNPNDPHVAITRGGLELFTGHPDQALEFLDLAEQSNLHAPNCSLEVRGMALYQLRRYADAAATFARMSAGPAYIDRFLAACFAQMGQVAKSRVKVADALRREPNFTLRRYAMIEPYKLRADLDHMIEGMRKAGLPE